MHNIAFPNEDYNTGIIFLVKKSSNFPFDYISRGWVGEKIILIEQVGVDMTEMKRLKISNYFIHKEKSLNN